MYHQQVRPLRSQWMSVKMHFCKSGALNARNITLSSVGVSSPEIAKPKEGTLMTGCWIERRLLVKQLYLSER